MTTSDMRCDDCGHDMQISIGPGRVRRYRGEDGYLIPADLAFASCSNCGAEWLTASQIDTLSTSLESQRTRRKAARREAAPGRLVSFTTSGNAGWKFVKLKPNSFSGQDAGYLAVVVAGNPVQISFVDPELTLDQLRDLALKGYPSLPGRRSIDWEITNALGNILSPKTKLKDVVQNLKDKTLYINPPVGHGG